MSSGRPDPSDSWDPSSPSLTEGGEEGYSLPNVTVPLWALVFLNATPGKIQEGTMSLLKNFKPKIKRQPTQNEVQAIQDLVKKRVMIEGLRNPLAASVAFLLWKRGRTSFRFPFWQPKFKRTSPNVFPTFNRPIFTGESALKVWHFTRFTAYFTLSFVGIGANLNLYTLALGGMTIKTDPRLEAFRMSLASHRWNRITEEFITDTARVIPKMNKKELIEARARIQGVVDNIEREQKNNNETAQTPVQAQDEPPVRRPGELYDVNDLNNSMIATSRKVLERIDRAIELKGDAQETFEQQADYETLSAATTSTNDGSYPGTTNTMGLPPRQGAWGKGSEATRGPDSQKGDGTASDDWDGDFDDGSPVAPGASADTASTASDSSAWDRVRQQAKSEQSGARQPSSQQSQSTDSHSYGSDQESKSSDKTQAQKEFDDMLDSERRS